MILFCIDNCRWRTLIQILHNSIAEHVDADDTEQVKPVHDSDEHVDGSCQVKKHLCNVFLNELLIFIKIKIN